VLEQTCRTCGDQYEQGRHVASDLPMREFGYVIFDACELVSRGILKDSDLNYVRPPALGVWRIHQMLLESEVSSDLANRYFTAILLALEVEDRAGGAVEVHDDRVEVTQAHGDDVVVQLDTDGRLRQPRDLIAFDHELNLVSGCVRGRVSIGATVPIGNLRWLLDAASEHDNCKDNTLTLAVSERADLFRPLRAELDLPAPGIEHKAELELTVDSTGAWHADDGTAEGSDAAALAATLDRRKPASLRVRTSASAAASAVVDVLRVPDLWSARARRSLDVWLEIEGHDTGQ
jgi:hypothetical protein